MKKLLLTLFALLLIPIHAYGWSTHKGTWTLPTLENYISSALSQDAEYSKMPLRTHPWLTLKALELVEKHIGFSLTDGEKVKIISGSIAEDFNELALNGSLPPANILYESRTLNHFEPYLTDNYGVPKKLLKSDDYTNRTNASYWALQSPYNLRNLYAIRHAASEPDVLKKLWVLGHLVHLLEDMSSPAHVHNDAHAYKDSHEDTLKAQPFYVQGEFAQELYNTRPVTPTAPILKGSYSEYFSELSRVTRQYFFSNNRMFTDYQRATLGDTNVGGERGEWILYDRLHEIRDSKFRVTAAYLITNTERHIAKLNGPALTQYKKNPDSLPQNWEAWQRFIDVEDSDLIKNLILDDRVVWDSWRILWPLCVQYAAGFIMDYHGTEIGYVVSGKITANGNPLPNIRVTIDGDGSLYADTDQNGDYKIRINSAAGIKVVIRPISNQYIFANKQIEFTSTGFNISNKNFEANIVYVVSGRITSSGTGLMGVRVDLGGRSEYTDTNGYFSIANVPAGTYTITLYKEGYTFSRNSFTVDVSNSNITIQDVSAILINPAQSVGWLMEGFDVSRTNRTPAVGPHERPMFMPIISNISGSLRRIGRDGSLILTDASNVYSYTKDGQLKWSAAVPGGLADVAIGPTGDIFISTSTSVIALHRDTGQKLWPSAFVANSGDQSRPMAIASDGTIYFNTWGSSLYPSVVPRLTAINPDGTLKWEASLPRAGSSIVLNTSETRVYILGVGTSGSGPYTILSSIDASTGQVISQATDSARNDVYAYAPWGEIYTGQYYAYFMAYTEDLSTTRVVTLESSSSGIFSISPNGVIVSKNSPVGTALAIDRTGRTLWRSLNELLSVFSDGADVIYAVERKSAGADLIAINMVTGQELWRLQFPSSISAVLLGGDGNLYLTTGGTLYKGSPYGTVCTKEYTIQASVTDVDGARVTPSGAVKVCEGRDITFTFQRIARYCELYDVRIDNISAGMHEIYTFTNVISDHTIIGDYACPM